MAKKKKRFITAQDLYKIKTVEDPKWSPDGRQVAFVLREINKGKNTYNTSIWRWQADWKEPRRFTNSGKMDFSPQYDPKGERLAFLSTRADKPQVFLIRTDGGEAKQLTTAPNGVTGFNWSPDGKYIAYTTGLNKDERRLEKRGQFPPPPPKDKLAGQIQKVEQEHAEEERVDPRIYTSIPFKAGTNLISDRYNHIYILEVDGEDAKPRRLTDGDADYALPQWSPDGKTLWSSTVRRPAHERFSDADLVRIEVKDGKLNKLPRKGHFAGSPKPSPDGKWVACITQVDKSPYGHIGRLTVLKPDGSGWQDLNLDIDRSIGLARFDYQFYWDKQGKGLYCVLDDEGDAGIYYVGLEATNFVQLVKEKHQLILEFDVNDEGEFAFIARTPERPPDFYITSPMGQSQKRQSDFNADFLDEVQIAKTEEFYFNAPDGKEIQGWMVKPPDFTTKEKWPLALNIHGGPHVMWSPATPALWLEWQVHAARGYVVFYCNPRGSDGYGDAFRTAIHNDWGESDMPDILAGVDAVVAQGYIDEKRMAVTGGSYGGFMTAWIVGHDKRFAAAVSQRGVYQLMSFYGASDAYRLIDGEFGVMAFDDPEKMWKYSPLAYVRNIRTPLMILHSDNDYRVPIIDAEQLFTALKRLNRKVEFVRYPRDGHELSRSGEPKHRVDRLERMTGWFDKYCKPRKIKE